MSRKRVLTSVLLVAVLLATAGALAGCGGGGNLGPPDATAVTVQKVTISNGQVDRLATFLATAPDPTTGEAVTAPATDSDAFWAFRRQAAAELRDQAVYGILASRCGTPCTVSDAEIAAQIKTIQTQQFGGSKAQFETTLAERGITRADLVDLLRAALQEQTLVARQQAGVTFSTAQARAYYDKNIAQYTTPASKHLFHILLPTKAAATALRPQLTPSNFEQIARERSLDSEAKSTGGDLGPVSSPGLIPEIAAAASTLKPDVVSQPIETQFGWHLLIVRNIPTTVKSFEQVRAQIVRQQLQAARDKRVQAWRDGPVKKLQDAAVYANDRLAPATSTSTATGTTPTTGTGSTGASTAP